MITLTRQLIDDCETKRGGITYATRLALTGKQQPKKGWRKELVGTMIDDSTYSEALKGRHKFSKATMKMKTREQNDSALISRVSELEEEVSELKDALETLYKEVYK